MAWEKQNKGSGNYIKFEDGKSYEGLFKEAVEKPSPFTAGAMLWDYTLEIDGKDYILSSGSSILSKILPKLKSKTKVKIDMRIWKGRKIYDVFTDK